MSLGFRAGAVMVVAVALTAGGAAMAQSMTCPAPHPTAGPGVLKESATQLAETGSFLANSNDPNRVSDVAADLRARYPGVSDTEIVNYLVAAYCPQIAKLNGLTVGEQTARVERFSGQAETLIHQN